MRRLPLISLVRISMFLISAALVKAIRKMGIHCLYRRLLRMHTPDHDRYMWQDIIMVFASHLLDLRKWEKLLQMYRRVYLA